MPVNWQRKVLRAMQVRNHPVEVVGIADPTPWYRRITLAAPEFVRGLEIFPTIWLRLWVPSLTRDGLLCQRGYTILDPDPDAGTFALEFVLHEPVGPAGSWAADAALGDRTEIAVTPHQLLPDRTIPTFALVGDSSALPAINSLLVYLPESTRTVVILEEGHPDRDRLPVAAGLGTEVMWVDPTPDRSGAAATLARAELHPEHTYVWAAGERKLVKAVRSVVKDQLRLPKDRHFTQNYWIEGRSAG